MPTKNEKFFKKENILSAEQIKKIFPNINVARMDWDSTRGKWDFDNIIEKFHDEKIQILVGTQMVVKGLDFKNVLLVGVINADNINIITSACLLYFLKKSGVISPTFESRKMITGSKKNIPV